MPVKLVDIKRITKNPNPTFFIFPLLARLAQWLQRRCRLKVLKDKDHIRLRGRRTTAYPISCAGAFGSGGQECTSF